MTEATADSFTPKPLSDRISSIMDRWGSAIDKIGQGNSLPADQQTTPTSTENDLPEVPKEDGSAQSNALADSMIRAAGRRIG